MKALIIKCCFVLRQVYPVTSRNSSTTVAQPVACRNLLGRISRHLPQTGMSSVECQGARPFGAFSKDLAIYCNGYYARAHVFLFSSLFAKLRKAAISFVMSVRFSALHNSSYTGRIFVKFGIWIFFENTEKIQVSLKSAKNEGCFTWRSIYNFFYHISLNYS